VVGGQWKGAVAIACWWVALQPAQILAAKGRPGAEWPVSQLLDPGAGLGPRLRRYPVRPTPWAYDGVPGEGSIPVPLPPPLIPATQFFHQ